MLLQRHNASSSSSCSFIKTMTNRIVIVTIGKTVNEILK